MSNYLWLFVVAGGPILIALVIAYGMMRSRRLTPGEKEARHEAIEELYQKDDKHDARPSPR